MRSRERELLIAAVQEPSAQRARVLVAACSAQYDWSQVLTLAEQHGVLALLARSLRACQAWPALPDSVRHALDRGTARWQH